MKRIIFNIDERISDTQAVESALAVILEGKISKTSKGEQYCFHSVTCDGINVSVMKLKSGTETFLIYPANALGHPATDTHHNESKP